MAQFDMRAALNPSAVQSAIALTASTCPALHSSVNIVVPASSVSFKGEGLVSFAHKGGSGKSLSRKFCRNCGSSIATEAEALPGALIIKAGTLDDSSWLKPNTHLWTSSAQSWVRIDPEAKAFPKGRT